MRLPLIMVQRPELVQNAASHLLSKQEHSAPVSELDNIFSGPIQGACFHLEDPEESDSRVSEEVCFPM